MHSSRVCFFHATCSFFFFDQLLSLNDVSLVCLSRTLSTCSVAWLERFLMDYKGTVMVVTHDRYFLDNVVSHILELDRGMVFRMRGNYSAWLTAKANRLM